MQFLNWVILLGITNIITGYFSTTYQPDIDVYLYLVIYIHLLSLAFRSCGASEPLGELVLEKGDRVAEKR